MTSRPKIDGRHVANSSNDARESTVDRMLKGEVIVAEYVSNVLPCGSQRMTDLVATMHAKYPQLQATIERVGGMQSKDYRFQHDNQLKKIELKSVNKTLSKAALAKIQLTPWAYSCEVLQGQLKNREFQQFLGPYKEDVLVKQYFEEVIVRFMEKYNIQGPIDWENYKKVIYTLGSEKRNKMLADANIALGARNLIKFIQENKAAKAYLAKAWKVFSNIFMATNRLDHDQFEAALKKRLAEKHIWIVISKNCAVEIEGPQCVSLMFDKLKTGTTTCVLQYILELKKPSEEHTYKVAMEFRLHWKNIGQGVGNPNFMLK